MGSECVLEEVFSKRLMNQYAYHRSTHFSCRSIIDELLVFFPPLSLSRSRSVRRKFRASVDEQSWPLPIDERLVLSKGFAIALHEEKKTPRRRERLLSCFPCHTNH